MLWLCRKDRQLSLIWPHFVSPLDISLKYREHLWSFSLLKTATESQLSIIIRLHIEQCSLTYTIYYNWKIDEMITAGMLLRDSLGLNKNNTIHTIYLNVLIMKNVSHCNNFLMTKIVIKHILLLMFLWLKLRLKIIQRTSIWNYIDFFNEFNISLKTKYENEYNYENPVLYLRQNEI